MNEHKLYSGWYYVAEGYRNRRFYYPFDLLEMPLNLGDRFSRWVETPGIDSDKALDQLAELMGVRFLTDARIESGNLIFNGEHYELTKLKNPQKKVDKHNAAVAHYRQAKADKAADDALTINTLRDKRSLEEIGVTPGWFARAHGCSVWCEVLEVYHGSEGLSDSITIMDRSNEWDGELVLRDWIYAVRPTPPKYGEMIRADGTANYYDKTYPRKVVK